MENYENIEENVIEGELSDTDVNINPVFYLHNAIMKAQQSLISENINDGILKYRLLAGHAEVVAKANNLVGNDFDDEINKLKNSEEYKRAETSIKHALIADKIFFLILRDVCGKKPLRENLKLSPQKKNANVDDTGTG